VDVQATRVGIKFEAAPPHEEEKKKRGRLPRERRIYGRRWMLAGILLVPGDFSVVG
jgi:hypothetical protein